MTSRTDLASTQRAQALARFAPARRLARVGPWELVERLGEGAWSVVYLARPADSAGDRAAGYALKTVRESRQDDPAAVDMLRREALVGRSVSHPNLVAVLSSHTSAPPHFVVMPRLVGCSAAALLAEKRRLGVPEALGIVRQTAEALAAMHAEGWIHLDVKPGNIFFSPRGHATLLDLGFSRRCDEFSGVAERPVLGTIRYMAPELLTSGQPADARSDIYSLGAVLYELLSGRPPLVADDLVTLARLHRQEQATPLRRLAADVPRGVAELTMQMLSKSPDRRPESAGALCERLVALEIAHFAEREAV